MPDRWTDRERLNGNRQKTRKHGGLRGCWLFHGGGCPLLMVSVLSGNMSGAECEDEEEGNGRLWGCQV